VKNLKAIKMNKKLKIAILGMGYVGLPLAVEFGKKYQTIGFDIDNIKIKNLKKYIDINNEINKQSIKRSANLEFSNKIRDLEDSNVFIITVPTPLKQNNIPDLSMLTSSCKQVSKIIKKHSIVIIESTVYPGVTEEICAPLIEKYSGFIFNKDFYMGYSPERINPGDKKNTLKNINKLTSGSNKRTAKFVDNLYKSIVTKAKTYLVSSIKIAEAAKVIENAQRDINIAFVNELSMIFKNLDINSSEVFDAANTKWNYLNFRPGLVGGHCIGIDPYYLSFKSEESGYKPEIILAGRNINEKMSGFITKDIIKLSNKVKFNISSDKILLLGLTFKENCKDIRNSKVKQIYNLLRKRKYQIDICDPNLTNNEIINEYKEKLKKLNMINFKNYKIIVLAVAHKEFKKINPKKITMNGSYIYDIKNFFNNKYVSSKI
jgi:UDP-N-acetyl-D-glucosamine/UDP-N-acetyl-D-galactosamine dehydrogenase